MNGAGWKVFVYCLNRSIICEADDLHLAVLVSCSGSVVAMSCELEAFENCFMTFPVGSDDDDSSEWKYQNDVPVIVLLGWTGCQQRHLKKYSAIYEKK